MSNKSIPSEVAKGVSSIGTGVISELRKQTLEAAQVSAPKQKSTQNLEDLIRKDQEEKEKGIPSIKMILEQQGEEKKSIDRQEEERKQKEVEEQEAQTSAVNDLSATGHKQSAPDLFSRKSKEQLTKQGT